MLSLLPAKIIKLLEWVGFSGDKVIFKECRQIIFAFRKYPQLPRGELLKIPRGLWLGLE